MQQRPQKGQQALQLQQQQQQAGVVGVVAGGVEGKGRWRRGGRRKGSITLIPHDQQQQHQQQQQAAQVQAQQRVVMTAAAVAGERKRRSKRKRNLSLGPPKKDSTNSATRPSWVVQKMIEEEKAKAEAEDERKTGKRLRLPRTKGGRLRPGIHLIDFRPDAPRNTTQYILKEREKASGLNASLDMSVVSASHSSFDEEEDDEETNDKGTMMHFSRELKDLRRDLSASPQTGRSKPSSLANGGLVHMRSDSFDEEDTGGSTSSEDKKNLEHEDAKYDPTQLDEDLQNLSLDNLRVLHDRVLMEIQRRSEPSPMS